MTKETQDRRQIEDGIREAVSTVSRLAGQADTIAAMSRVVVNTLKQGHKVLTAGNGGSAAEALHMAEELVGRFRTGRRSLPAVALVADCTALTCIANDFGYDSVFSRQVEGLGTAGDVLVLFSTSGSAPNLSKALKTANLQGMQVLCLLGRDGGRLAGRASQELIVDSRVTERIQEAHQVVLHLILDAVETAFERGT